MTKKILWVLIGILSTLVGLYPLLYFFIDRKFGLLSSKTPALLQDQLWNIAFYGHIVLGGIALLIGWIQFSRKIRQKNTTLHRNIGKVYIATALLSGFCGFYLAFFATGGIICILGFASLAVYWISSTSLGLNSIKKGKLRQHENFMIFSYAACFSAVTLRIWLPVLTGIFGEFIVAYKIVSWLCWVPNLLVAFLIVSNRKSGVDEDLLVNV